MINKIMLGSAQWGMNYGISNTSGITSKLEVNQMLENSIDSDFLNKTKEELHKDMFALWNKKQEEDKQFKEKMQRQLLALNNKILRLLGD